MSFRTLLTLAWRESRFARRRLFLFLSAISLGVAALVAVKGFAANLSRGVREESKSLLGADAVLASRQPFEKRTEALIDSLTRSGVAVARVTSFNSMALQPGSGNAPRHLNLTLREGLASSGCIGSESWRGMRA